MRNKLFIYLILLLMLVSIGYAVEYKKVIMDKIECTGEMKVLVSNNPACKIRDCSLSVNIWTCDCSTLKQLEVYTNAQTICPLTIEYYLDKSKVVFPFTANFIKTPANTSQPNETNEVKEDVDTVIDYGKLILTLAFIIVVIIMIIILVARYIIKLAMEEAEEERKRDERN